MECRTRDQVEEQLEGLLKLHGVQPNYYVIQCLADYVEEIVQEEIDEIVYDVKGIVS